MINVVTDFSAQNNGVGSNYTPFMNALQQAITNGGDEIYFPPGIYKIKGNAANAKPIYKTGINNIKLYGKGAVIVCDTNIDEAGQNGSGGGFTLTGNNISIEDLQFEGMTVAINNTSYGYGRLVRLTGDYNTVANCGFKFGNGGAIEIAGLYNKICGNSFYKCNNYPLTGADYGSIQIGGGTQYLTISENSIIDQFYSGICAYGDISYIDIAGNYIRSFTSSTSVNHSMGIFLLQGAHREIKIIGNTIEKIDAEGIIITSATGQLSSSCVIAENIIRDCDYRGISLDRVDSGGTFSSFTISNNIIQNSGNAPNYDHLIWADTISDSRISGNRCIGYDNGTGNYTGSGIIFSNSCPRNQVTANSVSFLQSGIDFYSPDGILSDNLAYKCNTGINLAYCLGANIHGNMVKFCTTGIHTSQDPAPQIYGNSITDCTQRFNTSGTVIPEVLTHTGAASGSSYSSFMVTGTLVSGAATVTFYHVYANDRFLVLPHNQSTDVAAALYVSAVNVGSSTLTVRSTLNTDTRQFTVIKILAGG